jgi:hypothetical protein
VAQWATGDRESGESVTANQYANLVTLIVVIFIINMVTLISVVVVGCVLEETRRELKAEAR